MVEINNREAHPEGLTEAQERLALQLFDVGAIKFGDFKLKLHEKNPQKRHFHLFTSI